MANSNIMLLFLTPFRFDQREYHCRKPTEFQSKNGEIYGVQTNEAPLRYIYWKLRQVNEHLDRVFIFATPDTNKQGWVYYYDGQKKFQNTCEYLHDVITADFPEMDNSFELISYDDDKPVNDSIQEITDMAQHIHRYVDDLGITAADTVVHADITGGFRHATMMMMSLVQLLRYDGFKMGNVFYANIINKRIEDVTEIQRTFDLISGAEEFVNFGSAQALQKYFVTRPGLKKSAELEHLLSAIDDFTAAIRLCHTSQFVPTIIALRQCIGAFEKLPAKSLQEGLLAEIIGTVEREYHGIIKEEATRLDIIRWCIAKKFLQQAMTMYTEWIPEFLVDKKLYYPAPEKAAMIKGWCKMNNMGYKKWQNVFVMDYTRDGPANVKAVSSTGSGKTMLLGEENWQGFRSYIRKVGQGSLVDLAKPYKDIPNIVQLVKVEIPWLKKGDVVSLKKRSYAHKRLPICMQIIETEYAVSGSTKSLELFTLTKASVKFIADYLEHADLNTYGKLFDVVVRQPKQKTKPEPLSVEKDHLSILMQPQAVLSKWQEYLRNLQKLWSECCVVFGGSQADTVLLLHYYQWMVNMRNSINHAGQKTNSISTKDMIKVMNDSLDLLDGVIADISSNSTAK